MAKVISCPCGTTIRAETDDELVALVTKHAREVHNQEAKREEILAMAKPE
ncbi:MAG TPA: DUF1059 domain-containing protein [Dehalococcoidia bacterium]|nr:DUF1059 domain-containing protein [Dehalococcoidia bacterium]